MDVPRRIQPDATKRLRTLADHQAGGSLRGSTAWGKRLGGNQASGGSTASGFTRSAGSWRDRITVQWFTDDMVGFGSGRVTGWNGGTFDSEGDSIGLGSPDDGYIYLFGEGVYAAALSIENDSIDGADPSVSLRGVLGCIDAPDSESVSCGLRGGDATALDAAAAGVSRTFYSEGGGSSGQHGISVSLATLNPDNSLGRLYLTLTVQRVA